jgi:hypothetical protein
MAGCNHTGKMTVVRPWSAGRRFLVLCCLLGVLVMYGVAIWWGELNQDEGWYLYAARMVSEGNLPYRDFAFTQAPLMAYAYAVAYPLVEAGGVLGGRIFTAALGLAALALAVYLARQMARRSGRDPFWPGCMVAAFCGLNLYQVYFSSIIKTYSLAMVFVLGGLLLLDRALALAQREQYRLRVAGYATAGGFLVALAAGTRLSAAFLLPACWLPLAVLWLRNARPSHLGVVLAGLLAGGSAGVFCVFLPFVLLAPQQLVFGLLQYHAGRAVDSGFALLVYKAGFVLRLVQAYWPLLAAGCVSCVVLAANRKECVLASGQPWRIPLWTCFLAVTATHLLSAFPYDDYQVFVMPLVAIAVSLQLAVWLESWSVTERWRIVLAGSILLVLFLSGVSGSMLQGWILGPRDRIWWPLRAESSLGQLRRIGAEYREGLPRSKVSGMLLTQDTYLAVEAGLRVPAGMEMGPFSNFLELSDEDAAFYGVLNRSRLADALASVEAGWAAYSEYGFAILAPDIVPVSREERETYLAILRDRFVRMDTVPAFGQAMTDLHRYKRRDP